MRNHFLLADGAFDFLLDALNVSSLHTFAIHPCEWEFHTDSAQFDDVRSFSATMSGFVEIPQTLSFSMSATIVSIDQRTISTHLESNERQILIPFISFSQYSVREAAMMVQIAKTARMAALTYSRI